MKNIRVAAEMPSNGMHGRRIFARALPLAQHHNSCLTGATRVGSNAFRRAESLARKLVSPCGRPKCAKRELETQ